MQYSIIFLTIIFLTDLVGMYFGMYSYWWFDMTHHFLGGVFVAMLMWNYLKGSLPKDNLKKTLVIVGVVSFIGVMWEFAEYIASQTLIGPIYNNFGVRAYFIGDLNDTMNDLLMDILGAGLFAWARVLTRRLRRDVDDLIRTAVSELV